MSNGDEAEDYKVGYRKPPKSGQFKKGVSGNPSGRPKKPSDFASELKKELQAKVIVNENGKRKVITKAVGIKRQVVNKALSGNLLAARLVDDWKRQAKAEEAEQAQNSRNKPDIDPKPEDMTDEELLMVIQGIHPKYSKSPNAHKFIGLPKIGWAVGISQPLKAGVDRSKIYLSACHLGIETEDATPRTISGTALYSQDLLL